jgi:hypothetical protein
MTPRPFITFVVIPVGTSVAIAMLMAVMGWTVNSPSWAGLAPIGMRAPALGSLIARRMEHPRFDATLPLRRWGSTGSQVILLPVAMPLQVAYHAPLMIGAEYAEAGSLASSIAILAVGDLPISFIMARESYRARSLWPAVFFHSFHNTISQWLFPRFFAVDTEQPWLRGEAGVLQMATA